MVAWHAKRGYEFFGVNVVLIIHTWLPYVEFIISLCYVHAVLILSSMAFHADRPIKRSRSPQDSSPIVLTHGHVADALSCSPDHGATLILSKLNASEWDITAIRDLLSLDEDAKDARPPIERYVTESTY
jgi:hypothetical protein